MSIIKVEELVVRDTRIRLQNDLLKMERSAAHHRGLQQIHLEALFWQEDMEKKFEPSIFFCSNCRFGGTQNDIGSLIGF